MKILILGGSGMLGHKIYQVFSDDMNVKVTFRKYIDISPFNLLFNKENIFENIDANDFESVQKIINSFKPNILINCIGIIKQLKEAFNYKVSISINSLFPHLLAEHCTQQNVKLIHISTDCVFSGEKGNYSEDDNPDPKDLYGRSKLLGEVDYGSHLSLRTSIIGHELTKSVALIDWFLSQNNKKVNGYKNAIYSGFPTIIFAKEVLRIIKQFPDLSGLYHVSLDSISKYELLQLVKKTYKLNTEIEPSEDFYCNRSLNSDRYRKLTNFDPLPWQEMIEIMYEDYLTNYIQKGIK